MQHTLFKRIALLVAVIATVALLGACEKGPGTLGPQGERGPQGPRGMPGSGVSTRGGVYRVAPVDFEYFAGGLVATVEYAAPFITQEVVDKGLVEAYTDLGTGASVGVSIWTALPLIVPVEAGGSAVTTVVSQGYGPGAIVFTIMSNRSAATREMVNIVSGYLFKVVVTYHSGG